MHLVQWMLADGMDVRLSPPPFDHSKIMTVDGAWSMLGSGNWDARSLRLNFEFDLECYSEPLARELNAEIDRRTALALRVAPELVQKQFFLKKVRNALAFLLEPYL